MNKGTVIRTTLLVLALANQMLVLFGKSPLPFSEELVEQVISTIFTIVSSVYAWYGNNYVSKKGKKQLDVLRKNGLSK
ncbi:phage holin [Paraliobacillus salinarum]|uniref:phage holin n=1 Tax=Paraliobacillus salinarum TaxID=1158996 RepID=UPI0015F468C9|nr:phage holin [Paraliobacillus salinarum]